MRRVNGAPLKVAVVHEWLVNCAGSEKVVEQILQVYPQADLFALVDFLGDGERAFLGGRRATTSFLQRMPFARRHYRNYLPLMPLAVEQFDLSAYDLVISSSHAVAKGVITGPDQVHVSYVHTPIRYAWDLQHQYLRESGMARGLKSVIARATLHYLRIWDTRSANGVDSFLANSAYVGRRIRKAYRREATVLYPPVDVARFALRTDKEDFYLTASRMVPYKRMAMIVEAFVATPQRRLVVIGDGPEFERVKAAGGAVRRAVAAWAGSASVAATAALCSSQCGTRAKAALSWPGGRSRCISHSAATANAAPADGPSSASKGWPGVWMSHCSAVLY